MNIATNFAHQKPRGIYSSILNDIFVNNGHLIMIYGPTCVGKTSTAIQLAARYNADIFSSDSRQIYKEMTIGTAVPSVEERTAITHHFIQNVSIHTTYSVGKFLSDFDRNTQAYFEEKTYGICVGGTGLYMKAIMNGLNEFPEVPQEILERVEYDLKAHGLKYLCAELKKDDPSYYDKVDLQNSRRIVRALSVIRSAQKPFSYFLDKKVDRKLPYQTIPLALTRERDTLYHRINRRVDLMIEAGLVNEVESLLPYKHLKALKTVGYSEIFDYLEGKTSLDYAIELIKRNTRRYAKRQMTWLRNQTDFKTFHPNDIESIVSHIKLATM